MTYFLTVIGALFALSGEVVSINSTSPVLESLEKCEAAKTKSLAEIQSIPGAQAIAFCTEAGKKPQGSTPRINVTEGNGPGRTP